MKAYEEEHEELVRVMVDHATRKIVGDIADDVVQKLADAEPSDRAIEAMAMLKPPVDDVFCLDGWEIEAAVTSAILDAIDAGRLRIAAPPAAVQGETPDTDLFAELLECASPEYVPYKGYGPAYWHCRGCGRCAREERGVDPGREAIKHDAGCCWERGTATLRATPSTPAVSKGKEKDLSAQGPLGPSRP